jgi:hypothetical protein
MAAPRPVAAPPDKGRQEALTQLDLYKVLRSYMACMIENAQGYKGLLLDKETMRIVSTLYGRTELAEQNVVHVECLETPDQNQHQELKVHSFWRLLPGSAAAPSPCAA